MKEFFGKVALITGAAHGIGYSFALEAASRGMKLALVDIDETAMLEAAKECSRFGAEVLTCTTDVSVYEEAKASVEATMATLDRSTCYLPMRELPRPAVSSIFRSETGNGPWQSTPWGSFIMSMRYFLSWRHKRHLHT